MKKLPIYSVINKLFLLIFFSVLATLSHAQTHHNNWINYDQTYFKFKVHEDGVHRINFETLQSAGLETVQGSQFKLFYKGQEVPIYVSNAGQLATTDYLEFFGEKNDGEFDTQLYQNSDWQPTDQFSLFTDTSRYYLTWDNDNNAQRYVDADNTISNPPAKENYFLHTVTSTHANALNSGKPERFLGTNTYFSDFGEGEGFLGSHIPSGFGTVISRSYDIETPSLYKQVDAPNASFECRVAGRRNDFTIFDEHHLQVELNGQLYVDQIFKEYEIHTYRASTVFLNNITSPTTEVTYTALQDLSDQSLMSIIYTSITYPHSFDFKNKIEYYFILENSEEKYIEIEGFLGGTNPVLYDLTHHKRYTPVVESGVYKFHLPAEVDASTQSRKLLLLNTDLTLSQPSLHTIEELSAVNFTDYSKTENEGNYIILTHPQLQQGATNYVQEYANYRSSTEGGGYQVTVVNIEELYDQFAWGISKNPLAVRYFVDYALKNWSVKPEYLLLLGKGVLYSRARFSPTAFANCLVPTFGQGASDNLLTTENIGDYDTRLAVGRVSALTSDEVRAYLDKIKEYENPEINCDRTAQQWARNVAHVVLARGNDEQEYMNEYVNGYKDIVEAPLFGASVTTYSTSLALSGNTVRFPEFEQNLEDGLGIVTVYGHSQSAGEWDVELEEPEAYNNEGKYPFILSGASFVGNVYNSDPSSLSERFVLADNSGAIGFLGNANFAVYGGLQDILDDVLSNVYQQFSKDSYAEPIGTCILKTLNKVYIEDITQAFARDYRFISEGLNLQGDPAVILAASAGNPEFLIENNESYEDVKVYDAMGNQLTDTPLVLNEVTGLSFHVTVNSIGRSVDDSLTLRIMQNLPDGSSVLVAEETVVAPVNAQTYVLTPENVNTSSGEHTFSILIDPDNVHMEDCEDNNEVNIAATIEVSCADVGAPCDDGDDCTNNDVLQADCTCKGTLLGPDSCDDGQACTTDTYNYETCSCEYQVSLATPTVTEFVEFCGNNIQTLTATGAENATFEWYADREATNLLHTGANYQPDKQNKKYYVLQTVDGCISKPSTVEVQLKEPQPFMEKGPFTVCDFEEIETNINNWKRADTAVDFDWNYLTVTLSDGRLIQHVTCTVTEDNSEACVEQKQSFNVFMDTPIKVAATTTCINEDEYEVQLRIDGGFPPYIVNGVALKRHEHYYYSEPIPINEAYNFEITGYMYCKNVQVSGGNNIDCGN